MNDAIPKTSPDPKLLTTQGLKKALKSLIMMGLTGILGQEYNGGIA